MQVDEQVTLGRKIAMIRNAKDVTQLDLANETGYSSSLIGSCENGRRLISRDFLDAVRVALNIENVPLLTDEIAATKKELYSWKDMISYGNTSRATELHGQLAFFVEWSFDKDLINLFDIFCIKYYARFNKKEELDKIVNSLHKQEPKLTNEQLYWYYCHLGFLEHSKWRYKPAVNMYFKAEKIGNQLNLNDGIFYYNIGNCLINRGYAYLASMYFEKVDLTKFDLLDVKHRFTMQRLLAICYSKLGIIDKPLESLNKCIEYLTNEKIDDKPALRAVYSTLGRVYQQIGDSQKTIECFDMASKYCDEESEVFLEYLCYRAMFLRDNNMNDEVIECLNKGLPLAIKGTLWYEWLNAIKHSITLDDKASINYMQWTAIPRLNEYGKHWEAMMCYKWLSNYHEQDGKYKAALQYSHEASAIYDKLMKGDLSL